MGTIKNEEMNVLLLAMSTLRDRMENVYQYKGSFSGDTVWYFKGISQLEPDTKLVLSILDSMNQEIDKIIILASPEALDDTIEYEQEKVSSVNYYKDRIISYAKGTDRFEKGVNLNPNLKIGNVSYHYLKKNYDLSDRFEEIKAEENESLLKTVNKLTSESNGKKINLYIDVQGGGRSSMAKINAIVELLKKGNLEIKGRFANEFNFKSDTPNPIKEVSKEYETYNLVTAMEIFRKYGRGDELNQFFHQERWDLSEESEKIALVTFITQASDAIQLCDVTKFDNAINNIAEQKAHFNAEDNSLYGIVCKEIFEDYSLLISEKDKCTKYITQVEWCFSRDFIQQALTIIESQMPQVILQCQNYFKTINFDHNPSYKKQNGDQWELAGHKKISEIIDLSKKKWEKEYNYIFETWAFRNVVDKDNDHNYLYIGFPNDQAIPQTTINQMDITNAGTYFWSYWRQDKKTFKAKINVLKNNINQNDLKRFLYFVNLHMLLKNQRNMTNHAIEGGRASLEQVKNAISVYIQLAKELL